MEVTLGGAKRTLASGIASPVGVAVDAAGNAYVTSTNDAVLKVTPGGSVNTFASGFGAPDGLAFDMAGNLYVANSAGAKISEVTAAGERDRRSGHAA